MIPKFDNFFLPCLQCLNDGNIHSQESLRNYVINYFQLSAVESGALIKRVMMQKAPLFASLPLKVERKPKFRIVRQVFVCFWVGK